MDFEAEIERLLAEVDPALLKICLDTGHSHYAELNPVAFMKRHMSRIACVHFKDMSPKCGPRPLPIALAFTEACGQGIFCNLGKGMTDFKAVKALLDHSGYQGWCTVDRIADPAGPTSPIDDARANRDYLKSTGFN